MSHFYEGIDLAKLRCRQKEFIALVTGGPNNYEGADMKTAHCKLVISEKDFDVTWENLERALKCFQVGAGLVEELKAIFYSVRADVVTKKQEGPKGVEIKAKDANADVAPISKCPFSGKTASQG